MTPAARLLAALSFHACKSPSERLACDPGAFLASLASALASAPPEEQAEAEALVLRLAPSLYDLWRPASELRPCPRWALPLAEALPPAEGEAPG